MSHNPPASDYNSPLLCVPGIDTGLLRLPSHDGVGLATNQRFIPLSCRAYLSYVDYRHVYEYAKSYCISHIKTLNYLATSCSPYLDGMVHSHSQFYFPLRCRLRQFYRPMAMVIALYEFKIVTAWSDPPKQCFPWLWLVRQHNIMILSDDAALLVWLLSNISMLCFMLSSRKNQR